MMRILITGMSGVGKTTVIRALRALDFRAIDMDEPGWASSDEFGHQRWDVARLQELMGGLLSEPLFVSGCSEDQVALYAILEDYPPKRTEVSHSTKARLQNQQRVRKARGGAGRSHEKLARDRTVAAQAGYPRNSHNTADRCGSGSNSRDKLPTTHCGRRAKTRAAEQ